jgi:adenylyltransferase/sulfurtransferase
MSQLQFNKPRLLPYFYVRLEPAEAAAEESLVFTSGRRRIRVTGRGLGDFFQHVAPLLDGNRTFDEIAQEVAPLFSRAALESALLLLAGHQLLEDGAAAAAFEDQRSGLAPQLNFFRELGGGVAFQQRLAAATVTIIGATGAAAQAALSLALAGVGTLRLTDAQAITPADIYLSTVFALPDIGSLRADALRRKISGVAPETTCVAQTVKLQTEDDVARAVSGSHFVVCCVDPGLSSLLYQLNRVCHAHGIPWTSATVSGFEGILGPTVLPGRTPCYLCYCMRAVACADSPEDEFAFRRFLDQRKQDDSGQRENLVFACGTMGYLLGLEAMKLLTGAAPPAVSAAILAIDFLTMTTTKHTVLQKPWCPVCFHYENQGQQSGRQEV